MSEVKALEQRTRIEQYLTLSRSSAILAGSIAILQILYFALGRLPSGSRVLAIGIGVALLVVALRAGKTKTIFTGQIGLLIALVLANLGIFLGILNLGHDQHPVVHLLQWSLMFCYAAVPLLLLCSAGLNVSPGKVMLLLFSLFGALLAAEALMLKLTQLQHFEPPFIGIRSEGIAALDFDYDSELGGVYLPYGTIKSIYPTNSRRYFHEEPFYGLLAPRRWSIFSEPKNHIELIESPDSGAPGMRIEFPNLQPGGFVQLTSSPLPISQNQPYVVHFRARAERSSRIIGLQVRRATHPWDHLGLKKTITLTAEWQDYRFGFSATDDGPFGAVALDLSDDNVPVEISDVTFATKDHSPSPMRHVVTYSMNSKGFRDNEYSVDRPPGVFRIACIGDSVTMGEGVHFEDTFAKQLEGLLNKQAKAVDGRQEFQVMNFGVDGFSTREERILYERTVSGYDPDVVLLTMVSNDDMPWLEQRKTMESGELEDAGRFRLWRAAKRRFHEQRRPDFSNSVGELLRLHTLTEEEGTRLLVILFRFFLQGDDQEMVEAVRPVVEKTDIPWVDLVGVLLGEHPLRDLVVYYSELDDEVIDGHPNEIAHRIIAEEIQDFLMREKLIESR